MTKVFVSNKRNHHGRWLLFGEYDTPAEAQQVADDMNAEARRDSTGYHYQVRFSETVRA